MRKTIAFYEKEAADARAAFDTVVTDLKAARADAEKVAKQNLDAMLSLSQKLTARDKDVAALKQELFEAHQTIALQKGYLARVSEDDNMRELGPYKPESMPPHDGQLQSRRSGPHAFSSEMRAAWDNSRDRKPWHDR